MASIRKYVVLQQSYPPSSAYPLHTTYPPQRRPQQQPAPTLYHLPVHSRWVLKHLTHCFATLETCFLAASPIDTHSQSAMPAQREAGCACVPPLLCPCLISMQLHVLCAATIPSESQRRAAEHTVVDADFLAIACRCTKHSCVAAARTQHKSIECVTSYIHPAI